MKHNWEYKRLGSLCEIVRGGSPRPIQDFLTNADNGLNWIKIGDVAVGSKYITSTQEKIKPEGLRKTRQVVKGDFILSNSMSFGRPYILKIDGCIHDGWLAIKGVKNHFLPDFLYYFLSSPTTYSLFEKLVKGGVVSNLNSDIVKGISVPVPPMAVQEQIVAELDKINEVIADCRELLRNLDALAQSLFYDFFGDPISNPKAWKVKIVKEVAKVKIGPFGSCLHKEDYISGGTPLVNPIHMLNGYIKVDNDFTIDNVKREELINYLLKSNDIVFGRRGDIGRCALVTSNEDGYLCGTGSLFVRFSININPLFSLWCFHQPTISQYLIEKAKGATMLNINSGIIESIPLILPPLALQEKFAERIEAIEEQKKAVEQTIAELQTLLDSRMDYWFN